jgi:hypothetical protein
MAPHFKNHWNPDPDALDVPVPDFPVYRSSDGAKVLRQAAKDHGLVPGHVQTKNLLKLLESNGVNVAADSMFEDEGPSSSTTQFF